MTAPPSLKRFHLVLAHGSSDSESSQESSFHFWRTRFPDALITNFSFLDTSNVSFVDRAQALLLTITAERNAASEKFGPNSHLPCVFVCHGLGGSLVKQALVLASLDSRYGRYASDSALLILCNTPEVAKDSTEWQSQLCQLLTSSSLSSHIVSRMFNELTEALERLHWSFGAIRQHHSIVDIRSKDIEDGTNIDANPICTARGRSTIYTSKDEASVWDFTPGNSITEKIFDRISFVVKQERRPLAEQFHDFVQLLRKVDSNNYQLELSRPSADSFDLIEEHEAFRHWRRSDTQAPNLLYIRTPQNMSNVAIVSHLIEVLNTNIPDCTMISFSFSKQDLRTQSINTFYVSLIRQLLLSQLALFRRVSATGNWIKGEENFSYTILRGLFLSLLKGASPHPIVCVLHDAQDCSVFHLDHIVDLIKEFRRLSGSVFKVIVLSEGPVHGAFVNSPDVCVHIDLSIESQRTKYVEDFLQAEIGALVKNHPHWRETEDEIMTKLRVPSVTHIQAMTSMKLLNARLPSTRSASWEAIKRLPTTQDEVFSAAVARCESECQLPLKPLLQWISHSVRPLFMNELAAVIGLANSGSTSMETVQSNLPLDILKDLRGVNGVLIRTVGLQVLPIHKTIVPVLDNKWRLAGEDADSAILSTCLNYLGMILVDIPTTLAPSSVSGSSRSSRSTTPEPAPQYGRQTEPDQTVEGAEQQPSEFGVNKVDEESAKPPGDGLPSSLGLSVDEEKTEDKSHRLIFDLNQMQGPEYDLLRYAVSNWPEHYKRARNREAFKSQILSLFSKDHEVQAWSHLYQKFSGVDTEKFRVLDSLFNISCRFGLLDIAKDVIEAVKASKNSRYLLSKGLDLAVGFGHSEIVSMLIGEGAESDEAPSLAAEYGFLDVLKQLIEANPAMTNVEDQFHRPPFLLAALCGNEDIAAYLMTKGAKYTTAVNNNITALHAAATTGQLGLLRTLVGAGIDVHTALKNEQRNALMLAAAGGFDDVAKLLLDRGVRINDQDIDGETALHQAIMHGHLSTCRLLFAAGADIRIKTTYGFSPIHTASNNGFLGILQELLERSKDLLDEEEESPKIDMNVSKQTEETDRDDMADVAAQVEADEVSQPDVYNNSVGVRSPLELAASNGYLDITQELLKYPRYNSEKSRATALLIAANGGFVELIVELLKTNVTTVMKDTNGNTALHLATQEQHPDIVKHLLDSNFGPTSIFDINAQNKSGWTALHLAASSGRLITVDILLRNGANIETINSNGQTALHIAAYHNHDWVVRALLNHLAPDNTVRCRADSDGQTAFITAIRQGNDRVANTLIKKSASTKPTELQGQYNALVESVRQDRLDLVELLLDHGWDVNGSDERGNTALHTAANLGLLQIIELLISRGANIGARGEDGWTPLHYATRSEGGIAVRALLKGGADIDARNDSDETPLWRASYFGCRGAVDALLAWEPNPDLEAQDSDMLWTPLHACYDNAEITELLLKAGADPMARNNVGNPTFFTAADYWQGSQTMQKYINAGIDINTKNRDGQPLIHYVAQCGYLDVFKLLQENGADILVARENGETALHLSASNYEATNDTNYAILEHLLRQPDIDLEADCQSFGTPLMAAARSNPDATKVMLEKGAKVNAISALCIDRNAIQVAAIYGIKDTAVILINAGADVNIRGGTFGSALCAAIARSAKEITVLLLDKDDDLNYADGPQGSALELALAHEDSDIAESLFQRGVDVNVVSKGKFGTALIAAIHTGQIGSIEKLLELKADINLFPVGAETPIQLAVRKGRLNVVEALVSHGAQLDYKDPCGRGVLLHALWHQSFDLLPYLLQQPGIDINQQDAVGRTPLIQAALQGNSFLEHILEQNPKLDVCDRWGKTALSYAASRDYGLLVSKLLQAGASPLIADIRGHSSLYWAALQRSGRTFQQVLQKAEDLDGSPSYFQDAINAAVAANNFDFVQQLLEHFRFRDRQVDQDGWTVAYTIQLYNRSSIASLISEVSQDKSRSKQDGVTQPKLPTEWHPVDMSAFLVRQPDNVSITVECQFPLADSNLVPKADSDRAIPAVISFAGADKHAIARADHPMVPNEDEIYYFEVTFSHRGRGNRDSAVGVGFCSEGSDFDNMLGWQEGAWGYHSDDGKVFESGVGMPYGQGFDEGSVVGCGVNFKKGTAFYTQDGQVIGCAFTNLRGKLYPAVSVDTRMAGCILTAQFWSPNESANKLFKFQGPYDDPETLKPSRRRLDETGSERGEDSGSTSSDDDSSD